MISQQKSLPRLKIFPAVKYLRGDVWRSLDLEMRLNTDDNIIPTVQ